MNQLSRFIFSIILFFLLCPFGFTVQAQLNTNIDVVADKTIGCAPEVIKLNVTNIKENTSVTWIISNDTISGTDELSYIFANGGTFDVTAIVNLAANQTEKIEKKDFIKLGKSIDKISLSASRSFICEGADTVTFTASAAGAQSWDWIIDGVNYLDAGNKIIHKFTTPGYKKVSIRVKDSSGCFALKVFDSVVFISAPVNINFAADKISGCFPYNVNFTSSVPAASAGNIVAYEWLFPGSNISGSKLKNPGQVTYSQEGSFDVTLNVYTKEGCKYSITKKGFIKTGNIAKPTFTADKSTICPGDTVTFINTSSGIISNNYKWSFSGGSILAQDDSVTQKVVFRNPGSFDATLTYQSNGCTQSSTKYKIVAVENIKADFTADHFCGCSVPDTIHFQNTSVIPGNANVKYTWTFYDADGKVESFTNTENPTYVYNKYGKYKVKLAINNPSGCDDVIIKENFLDFSPLDTSMLTLDSRSGCMGQKIGLKAPLLKECQPDSFTYEWTFFAKDGKNIIKTVYNRNPTITYNETGLYSIKLKVRSAKGCEVEKLFINNVNITIPVPDFTTNNTIGCNDGSIALKQTSTPKDMEYAHFWELTNSEDSGIVIKGSGAIFKPVFPKPGIYHVRYTTVVGDYCVYTKERPSYLKISGIKGDFSVENNEGCNPFTTKLTSQIIDNRHYASNSGNVTYSWSASPAQGVKFSNPEKANTEITVLNAGCYSISLKITNSDGCVTVLSKPNLICAGVKADFSMPSKLCFNETTKLINRSSSNANSFVWSGSKGVKFSDVYAASPIVSFDKVGNYAVTLKVKSSVGCVDSVTKNIFVDRVYANFTSKDTFNTCAPAYVSFTANRMGADSFYWYFGDGEKLVTADTNIAHIYKINSGDITSGFDVMMVAKNRLGCTDTLIRKKYIKVVGPVPAFTISNNIGCEPLKVEFINKSEFTNKWYLDYNDHNRIDSIQFGPNVYTIKNPDAEFQVYKPSLLAKDKYGCSAFAFAEDSIVVYRKPKAGFTVANNKICQGTAIKFTNNSVFASAFRWDFNNDGIIDDTAKNPVVTLKAGIYSVKLFATNKSGCIDSVIMKNVIEIQPTVSGKIQTSNDTVCAGSEVELSYVTEKNNELISNVKWYIISAKNSDTISGNATSLKYTFQVPGNYTVKAEITTTFGCVTNAQYNKFVTVPDTNRAIAPQLYVVSVKNNASIDISWQKSKSAFFKKYILSRNGNVVFESASLTDTTFNDNNGLDVLNASYTYSLQTENVCSGLSFPSKAHTSVLLKAAASGINQLELNWNAYEGWPLVKEYIIYRSEDGKNFNLISKVDGSVNTFTDKNVCDKIYTYYVEATDQQQHFTSLSNISSAKPDYQVTTKGENVIYASVIDNKVVELKWNPTSEANSPAYIIDRFETAKGWINNYAQSTETQWQDANTDVTGTSYTYRIRIKNECGFISEAGTIGKTILLKAKESDDRIILNWNRYNFWSKGINHYRVEILDNNNSWKLVNMVSAADTSFIDKEIHNEAFLPYTYRVIAVQNGVGDIKSVSNHVEAMLPSRIFVPNAFTPNNDARNEKFKAEALFINEGKNGDENRFSLKVYNRWGEKLFETNSLADGWDGIYKGVPVPEGTYIYMIGAMGYDHHLYYLKGTFHLFK